jgi:hemoglobin
MTESDSSTAAPSLYDQVGGAPAITEAVERLYRRLLDDARVSAYFAGVDMPQLKRHQALLLSQVLGGPTQYDGRTLAAAHAGLGITPEQYAVVGGHLVGVLEELGAPANVVDAVKSVLGSVQADVVTAQAEGGDG